MTVNANGFVLPILLPDFRMAERIGTLAGLVFRATDYASVLAIPEPRVMRARTAPLVEH
jgi:hypothetical protein